MGRWNSNGTTEAVKCRGRRRLPSKTKWSSDARAAVVGLVPRLVAPQQFLTIQYRYVGIHCVPTAVADSCYDALCRPLRQVWATRCLLHLGTSCRIGRSK